MNPSMYGKKGSMMFRYTSIVLLLFGVMQFFQCVMTIIVLVLTFQEPEVMDAMNKEGTIVAMMILTIAGNTAAAVMQGISGFQGLRSVDNPNRISGCFKLGIVLVIVLTANTLLTMFQITEWSFTILLNIVLNILIPALYLYAAYVQKKTLLGNQ